MWSMRTLLLGESTICRGKAAFSGALEWHPAFVSKKLNLPFDLQLIVDKVACDGEKSVGVEWHVEVDGKPFPLSRGLSLATTNAEGKLERVVDIAEAPWRVVGLLIRPLLTAFGAGAAALGIGELYSSSRVGSPSCRRGRVSEGESTPCGLLVRI